MLKVRVMPCLLIDDSRLVKTVRFQNPAYIGDPVNAIKIYNEKEVDELILMDIRATLEHRSPPFDLLKEVADECFMPLTYGGGIRSVADARKILALGIEKIIINSYAIEHPEFITEVANTFGSQSIVVALDVKKNFFGKHTVYTHSGKKTTNCDPVTLAQLLKKMGAGELLLNSIDRDGTWEGYDLELIKKVAESVTIPVIACGGAGNIQDFNKAVKIGGASAVAAGSMVVYQGKDRGVLINFPSKESLKPLLL